MQVNLVRLRQENGLRFLNSLPSQQPKSTITRAEAEMLLHNISKSSQSIFKNVVILIDSHGFASMGFSKIQDCLRKKCPEISTSYISRLVSASNIFLSVSTTLSNLDRVSESTFRSLQDVSTADSKRVWELVISNTENKRISCRDIKRAMEALSIKANTSVSKSSITINLTIHKAVVSQAQKIAGMIGLNIKSKDEWRQFCHLLYKELMVNCPLGEEDEAI